MGKLGSLSASLSRFQADFRDSLQGSLDYKDAKEEAVIDRKAADITVLAKRILKFQSKLSQAHENDQRKGVETISE
jgi:hypothetical protein